MKSEQNRLNSFNSWWLEENQLDVSDVQRFAKAGFYLRLSYTACFSCGLSKDLSFWREGHDPETVHREESPDCKFITGQSDNVPVDIKLQENSKTSSDTSVPRVSGPTRFPTAKSNKSKQNQEVRQPNDNQTKLHSGSQQLKPDTGTKPKRTGENENSETKPSTRRSTEHRKSELKQRKPQYVKGNGTSWSLDARTGIPTISSNTRKEWFTPDTRGGWCVDRETATKRSVTGQENAARENLTRATDKQTENVSS